MSPFVIDGTVRYSVEQVGMHLGIRSPQREKGRQADLYETWVRLSPYSPRRASPVPEVVRTLLSSTGWSNRKLAKVVKTTHPTIGAIIRGREPERVPGIYEALVKTAEVVGRISHLVDGDQAALNRLLNTSDLNGQTPLSLLSEGLYAKALVAALRENSKGIRSSELLRPLQERDPGKDVAPIFLDGDDD